MSGKVGYITTSRGRSSETSVMTHALLMREEQSTWLHGFAHILCVPPNVMPIHPLLGYTTRTKQEKLHG